MKRSATTKVHVIFKTHLDIGFTDLAATVVQRYMTGYIPAALTLARAMREDGQPERFIWTTGSWLIYEYLEQADADGRRTMEAAIAAGDIAWHALPFTTHSEAMDARLFRYGLSLSQQLDARFGRRTIAAKMTDVPGHTLGIVPLLAEAGVQFLHIGVNPACRPPEVPDLFCWRHPTGAELVVMYHKGSYGSTMTVPGMTEAIAFAHTGDNQEPQSADAIRQAFAELRAQFPGATVTASTLDAYAAGLLPRRATLPVVTREIGDSWIHGLGTDPGKIAAFRAACRVANGWDPQARDGEATFTRRLLLVPEHTWGLDEKTHLADYRHYTRPDFAQARARDAVAEDAIPEELATARKFRTAHPSYRTLESSWAEQRAYVTEAMATVREPAHAQQLSREFALLRPIRTDRDGFTPLHTPGATRATARYLLRFDPATGALAALHDMATLRQWADIRHPLGLLRYQTFSQADYDRYLAQYCINMEHRWISDWAVPDLSKPGIAAAGAQSRWWMPLPTGFYQRRDGDDETFLVTLTLPEAAVTSAGAPAEVELRYHFPAATASVEFTVQWFDKAANRLPEALWCSFIPRAVLPRGWRLDKLGTGISPLEVVRNGNRHLHAVNEGIRYADSAGWLAIRTLDAPLVAPGDPSLLNFDQRQPNLKHGMHFNLYNNVWGTNFPMWYGEDAGFRFVLQTG